MHKLSKTGNVTGMKVGDNHLLDISGGQIKSIKNLNRLSCALQNRPEQFAI
jgi:hypothetical protein